MSTEQVPNLAPRFALQVSAASAARWDRSREQSGIVPTAEPGTVEFNWSEGPEGSKTRRCLFVLIEDVPELIAFLALAVKKDAES